MEHYFTNNNNLRSELRTIIFENEGEVFTFFSDLGVFSKDKVDFGSRVLVENILKNVKNRKTILDMGCGYGFIGIVLGKRLNANMTMVDVNQRAVHLCERNIKENKVDGKTFQSDIYENVEGKYDLIVTNPPIRAGKKVVLEILRNAKNYLAHDGELWFVIRKDQGVKSIIKLLEDLYELEVIEKEKGFYVVRAKIY